MDLGRAATFTAYSSAMSFVAISTSPRCTFGRHAGYAIQLTE